MDGDTELRQLERKLALAEDAHDAGAIAHIHERLNLIGGYAAHARAAQLLPGLGFAPAEQMNPVASFSGGWRMRLNQAQALMCSSARWLQNRDKNETSPVVKPAKLSPKAQRKAGADARA